MESLEPVKVFFVDHWKIIVGVVVALIAVVIAAHAFGLIKLKLPLLEGFQDGAVAPLKGPMFAMVQVDWCPHCKEAKPAFESLKANMDGKEINGKAIQIRVIDGETKNTEEQQAIQSWKVNSYPTFVLVKEDGTDVRYEGQRTESAMHDWLKTQL